MLQEKEKDQKLEFEAMEFEEKKMQFVLERLRLERETDRPDREEGQANKAGDRRAVFGEKKSPNLFHSINGKDKLFFTV